MKYVEKHSWSTIGHRVKKISPKLGAIIDKISPNDGYSLYLLRYPYGALILDEGVFQITDQNGDAAPLRSIDNRQLQEDLGYTQTIPMGLIMGNSIESFFSVKMIDRERTEIDRTVPSSFYTCGDMISLWRVLEGENSYQSGSLWNITSGSRTICMLPKISDKSGLDALSRKFGVDAGKPRHLSGHWEIFRAIANHPSFEQPWYSEVLCFSKKWFSHRDDEAWSSFYAFMLEKAWYDSDFKRNQFIFDFAFSFAQNQTNLKPNPYIADTVKHLIGIGTGSYPGFKPAQDNVCAPIAGLQKVFVEDYALKKYLPVIMYTEAYSRQKPSLIYYALEIPTTIVFSPVSNKANSKMVDMRELKLVLDKFLSQVSSKRLKVEKTPLFKLASTVEYNFYHTQVDQHRDIEHSPAILAQDKSFYNTLYKCDGLEFPSSSPFFNGCITIKLPDAGSKWR